MDRVLGPAVSRKAATRRTPDLLSVPVGVDQRLGGDAMLGKAITQSAGKIVGKALSGGVAGDIIPALLILMR